MAEAFDVEQTPHEHVELGHLLAAHDDEWALHVRFAVVVDAPAAHVFPRGERGAVNRFEPVGGDDDVGEAESHREFFDVGAQLVVAVFHRCGGPGLFQLHDGQGHAVDVEHYIEAAFLVQVPDGNLVRRDVVVFVRVSGEERDGGVLMLALGVGVFDAAVAFHEDLVEAVVLRNRALGLRGENLCHCLAEVLVWNPGVEVAQGVEEATSKHDVAPILPLPAAGGEFFTFGRLPIELAEQLERVDFEHRLAVRHGYTSFSSLGICAPAAAASWPASLTEIFPLMSRGSSSSRVLARV